MTPFMLRVADIVGADTTDELDLPEPALQRSVFRPINKGNDLHVAYRGLTEQYGEPAYARIDSPATREQKAVLGKLSPEAVTATTLAGEPITATLTAAPGNGAPLGGLKVQTENAWFAARPSGTEDVYKIYAESFKGPEHLAQVQDAAREVVNTVIA